MKSANARILLTGATGGIGQATARALQAAGARVMLNARSEQALLALARELGAGGEAPPWIAGDLADAAQAQRVAESAAHWECNVVVHAAGAPAFGPFGVQAPQQMESVLRTNLLAPMLLTQALLPHLRRQKHAQLMYVGSVLGAIALPGYATYCASKFGLRGFAEALRRELADTSVRVQYLGPRSTRTGFNSPQVEAYNQGTGTAMDDVDTVAAAIVRTLQDEAPERFLGFPERLGVRLNGLAPAAMDGSFRRHGRTLAKISIQQQRNPS